MTSQSLSFQFFLLLILILQCTITAAAATTTAAAPAPGPPGPANITKILEKSGQFTTLLRLFDITKVGDQINTQLNNSKQGMTVFAPPDNAFAGLSAGTLNSLSDQQKDELVQFHVIPTFIAMSQFQTLSNPLRTQAGESTTYKFPLNIMTSGNTVNLTTGVVNATVGNAVYSDGSLAVYSVDKVLLPMSLFGPPAPAAAPAPESGKDKKAGEDDAKSPGGDSASANSNGGVGLRCGVHGLMGGVVGLMAMVYL